MPLSSDEYRCKLINNLLFASSQNEVKELIDNGVQELRNHGANGHIVIRFSDKTIKQLQQFNPLNKNSQQWSNIKISRIYLNRIKRQVIEPTN